MDFCLKSEFVRRNVASDPCVPVRFLNDCYSPQLEVKTTGAPKRFAMTWCHFTRSKLGLRRSALSIAYCLRGARASVEFEIQRHPALISSLTPASKRHTCDVPFVRMFHSYEWNITGVPFVRMEHHTRAVLRGGGVQQRHLPWRSRQSRLRCRQSVPQALGL